MGMNFGGLFKKMETASVERGKLVEEGKIRPAGEVRSAMDVQIARERVTTIPTAAQKSVTEGYQHSGNYWKREGGTLTQTHPGLMNPTEAYMWRRKQAGLSTVNVAPAAHAEEAAVMQDTFGVPQAEVVMPVATAQDIRASAAESKAISRKAAEGRSAKVEAHEYIQHHAAHFGTEESASLGAGLHNLYSDEYAVIDVKPGITAVVDPRRDRVDIIHDRPVTSEERLSIQRAVGDIGDVPNKAVFTPAKQRQVGPTQQPTAGVGVSGGTAVSGGAMLLVVGVLAATYFLFFRRR